MPLVAYALAFAFFVVGAFLAPDKQTKAICVGLALLVVAVGLTR